MDEESGIFTLTVAEDLDCSGLPPTDEVVCNYDEGFIAGIMTVYTGRTYKVHEIDCWASGARVCRFQGLVMDKGMGS
ncbi:MAG: V4R domain-containing protein [Eubacterium aggregans]